MTVQSVLSWDLGNRESQNDRGSEDRSEERMTHGRRDSVKASVPFKVSPHLGLWARAEVHEIPEMYMYLMDFRLGSVIKLTNSSPNQ